MSEPPFGPVLIGMRGSGKTSVALPLARELGLTAIDADAELVRREDRCIPDIFATEGEDHFRHLEGSLLLELLSLPGIVVATGGGAVLHSAIRERLRGRLTVWLKAPVETLAKRIRGSDRPSLTGETIERELEGVLRQRAALYEEAASLEIETDGQSIAEIVVRICETWREMGVDNR